ncbi:MAG: hypothetical protein ACYTXE_40280 [Nostoc sp.]
MSEIIVESSGFDVIRDGLSNERKQCHQYAYKQMSDYLSVRESQVIRGWFGGYKKSGKISLFFLKERIVIANYLKYALTTKLSNQNTTNIVDSNADNKSHCSLLLWMLRLCQISVQIYISISSFFLILIILTPATLQHCSFMLQVSKPKNLATMCGDQKS